MGLKSPRLVRWWQERRGRCPILKIGFVHWKGSLNN